MCLPQSITSRKTYGVLQHGDELKVYENWHQKCFKSCYYIIWTGFSSINWLSSSRGYDSRSPFSGDLMSNWYWLTEVQMERLWPYLPKSRGRVGVHGGRVLSGIIFLIAMVKGVAMHLPSMDCRRRHIIDRSVGVKWACLPRLVWD